MLPTPCCTSASPNAHPNASTNTAQTNDGSTKSRERRWSTTALAPSSSPQRCKPYRTNTHDTTELTHRHAKCTEYQHAAANHQQYTPTQAPSAPSSTTGTYETPNTPHSKCPVRNANSAPSTRTLKPPASSAPNAPPDQCHGQSARRTSYAYSATASDSYRDNAKDEPSRNLSAEQLRRIRPKAIPLARRQPRTTSTTRRRQLPRPRPNNRTRPIRRPYSRPTPPRPPLARTRHPLARPQRPTPQSRRMAIRNRHGPPLPPNPERHLQLGSTRKNRTTHHRRRLTRVLSSLSDRIPAGADTPPTRRLNDKACAHEYSGPH